MFLTSCDSVVLFWAFLLLWFVSSHASWLQCSVPIDTGIITGMAIASYRFWRPSTFTSALWRSLPSPPHDCWEVSGSSEQPHTIESQRTENSRKTFCIFLQTPMSHWKKTWRKMTIQAEEWCSPLQVVILHHVHDSWEHNKPLGTGEPGS